MERQVRWYLEKSKIIFKKSSQEKASCLDTIPDDTNLRLQELTDVPGKIISIKHKILLFGFLTWFSVDSLVEYDIFFCLCVCGCVCICVCVSVCYLQKINLLILLHEIWMSLLSISVYLCMVSLSLGLHLLRTKLIFSKRKN